MPCNEITIISVNFEYADEQTLCEALAELGLDRVVSLRNGQLVGSRLVLTEERIKEVKRAYAAQVVKQAAKKFGWKLNKQGQKLTLKR